jgi:dephospho-CoA kinase
MIIVGLTGSIGMGKTTAADDFRRQGIPVYDADRTVHVIMNKGGKAVNAISQAFPGVVQNEAVDRGLLAEKVLAKKEDLLRLEKIVHPFVRQKEKEFLDNMARRNYSMVVLDIPLLFETGGDEKCDAVVIVMAPRFIQERRVLRRPGMTKAKLQAIRQRQTSEKEKLKKADFIVQTGLGRAFSLRAIKRIIKIVQVRCGEVGGGLGPTDGNKAGYA